MANRNFIAQLTQLRNWPRFRIRHQITQETPLFWQDSLGQFAKTLPTLTNRQPEDSYTKAKTPPT